MSVQFHSIKHPSDCRICWLDTDEYLISHGNRNNDHTFHPSCIKKWAEEKPTCPICMERIDLNSLFSWYELTYLRLRQPLVNINQFLLPTAGLALWSVVLFKNLGETASTVAISTSILFGHAAGGYHSRITSQKARDELDASGIQTRRERYRALQQEKSALIKEAIDNFGNALKMSAPLLTLDFFANRIVSHVTSAFLLGTYLASKATHNFQPLHPKNIFIIMLFVNSFVAAYEWGLTSPQAAISEFTALSIGYTLGVSISQAFTIY